MVAPLSVAEARSKVLHDVVPTPAELIAVEVAHGRVLADGLVARLTQPPFDASAMDGYAVRSADLSKLPTTLELIGAAAAGHPFGGTLGPGQAVRIFTGAPVPTGSDAIVIQEDVERDGGRVTIRKGDIDRTHIRPRGLDFSAGAPLLASGRRLGPREVSLAAAMGYGQLSVRRRPRLALISTGDELVAPGETPGRAQIVSSNHLGVAAMAEAVGAEVAFLGIARDLPESLAAHFEKAGDADVLVTIGGASVGDHDLVAPVLRGKGMVLSFWKIAMRPGKPLMFGRLKQTRILGLPGNPVSALVCARLFLVPLLRALVGLSPEGDGTQLTARSAVALEANGAREHYMRATQRRGDDGLCLVTPVRSQDSSLLSPLAEADCLLVRPAGAPAVPAGGLVPILPLDF
ncbi:MAG TPA: gephyrin-like molybdotransferase Glp [Hyphomicrobiaceae bacterium]|jgi:molybdopterin molybdotransferase|nr:gephyrin-like molybdotransferase Glp [Hyphomicrobiaceae bacterium]